MGFFGTALVIVLLALAVRAGSATYQVAAKVLAMAIGALACVFLSEHLFGKPLGTFDTFFFRQMLLPAGNAFPGRPSSQVCTTFILLAIAAIVFDRENKRRIEAFQVIVALAMFFPLLVIHGYLLSATSFASFDAKPIKQMSAPTLMLFFASGAAFFSFFPKQGLVSLFLGKGLAGSTVRRLICTVLLLPFALAWLLLWLTIRMNWPEIFSLSLFSLTLVSLLVALSFQIGYLIRRHEMIQKATERTLREQALILEIANDTIFIRDRKDRITYWNQGAQRLYGWSKEEALGCVIHSLLKTQQPPSSGDINTQLFATGHWEGELVRARQDGTLVTVASSCTLQRDDSNKAGSIIEVNYDITERKESEEALRLSERRFSSAFESAAIGMALVSLDGRWLKVNNALCESLGYSAEELSGKTFQEITHPDDLEADLAYVSQILNGEISSYKIEKRYFHKNGTVVWVLLGVSLLRNKQNEPLYFISQIQDIGEIKRAMTRQLELTHIAQVAERAQSDFLAVMSHEIRTPMNGVIGMTELLLDTGLNGEQRNLTETIRTSGEALLAIINDILDFSKIEAGQFSFEELDFDLREVVEDAMEMLASQAQARGIELVGGVGPEVPANVRGDRGRVRQVLTNLIGNAIKFTDSGEVAVRVIAQAETESEVHARFEIKDTGPGISPETQALLFQPFVQADNSTSRKFGGTGLGLAICKRLAELMNGSIGVESTAGEGSTFWVLLRLRRQAGAKIVPQSIPEFVDTRVLIVDDNETSRQFLHQQIIAWQLRNGCARTGEEALAMLRQSVAEKAPYSVAVIDMQMPEMDGLALARKIKADPLLNSMRLIILTPFGKPMPAEELKIVDVSAYCEKPVRQSVLFNCLAQVLCPPMEVPVALERAMARPVNALDHDALPKSKADLEGDLAETLTSTKTTGPDTRTALEKSRVTELYRDVTDRDRVAAALASQRHRLSTIMDSLPDNIWFKDRASRFVAANRAMLSWTGFKEQSEIIGKTDYDIFAEIHADSTLADEQKIVATGQPLIAVDQKETWADGHETWISTTRVPWRDTDGNVIGIFGWSRDITARRVSETYLKMAGEASEKAGRAKSEFLANMSHEIRTPMNGVIGMTDLLLDSELNRPQRELAKALRASADSLLKIINDILDFSRIEAHKLMLEILDFDLIKTVESSLDTLADRAQNKGIELAGTILPGTPTRLRGDPVRLRQILDNLIANAIKFTETGEAIVRVSKVTDTETYAVLRFEVQDTGIGIPPEAQARLFQAFSQADGSSTRKYGGTGLGLAIAKQLVEMMHGHIGVQSEEGKGSTFWFTARLEKPAHGVDAPERTFRDLFNFRVLVVDDNATNREILRCQILAWRMQVDSAASGDEALRLLRKRAGEREPYDLALLDVQMPDMGGLILARAIKSDPAIAGTRLIILTEFSNQVSAEESRAAEITGCCFKPVRQARLFGCLANALLGPSTIPRTLAKALIATNPPPQEIRVLVAEDNAVNQMVTLGQLKKLGYSADVVPDGFAVLAALDRRHYNIILMDCQMPGMDGYEATSRIRARTGDFSRPYIIAMTAHAMQGDREKCLDVGMNDYVSKPVQLKVLAASLARGLSLEAKENPLKNEDSLANEAGTNALSEAMLQSLQEFNSPPEGSSLPQLDEAFEHDAACRLGALRTAIASGNVRRLGGEGHARNGNRSSTGAEITGGISRYEIRSDVLDHSTQTTFVNAGSYHQARNTFEAMFPTARLGSIIYQGPSGELNCLPVQSIPEVNKPPSKYLFVSHIGSKDSNFKWFAPALKAFQERYPNVKADYLCTNEYSTEKYLRLLQRAISMKPDGLVVSITNAAALDGLLRQAIDQGIPVIAFNAPDFREPAFRIPYLTFVGTDYYQDGMKAGEHALAHARGGKIPMPETVLCANADATHSGLIARCQGMTDAMQAAGIKVETLTTDWDSTRAAVILSAHLARNPDVNYIYATTSDLGPTVRNVCCKMGLSPDLEGKAPRVTIIGVDDNPVSLSGVKAGHLLSTVSQGFWLQGYLPLQWLYWYREYGYAPERDISTGPVVIDKVNVDEWITLVQGVIGLDNFQKQIPW